MASNDSETYDLTISPVEIKEEPETLTVRKCRAKSQGIYLEASYRDLQRTAKELGLPCNLKKAMLRELIKAQSEGDQDEVGCILAEAKDIKDRKKIERQKKKENALQVIKQEVMEWPEEKAKSKKGMHQSLQVKDARASLKYLQRIIDATAVPNVTIKRISKTEVHTEYVQPLAGQTTCKSSMQNSTNHICASSTFVPPNPDELIANSSNYTDDKTKFSPKLTSGSCHSKRYLLEDPIPKRSEEKKNKRESYYSVNPTESSWLNHHNSLTNPGNHSRNPIKQKLHIPHSSYNYYQTPVFKNISDGQRNHNSQTRPPFSYPVGSHRSKNSSSHNTSTFLQNSGSGINYPFQPSYVIRSENQNKNTLSYIPESGLPDYSDKQMIRHAPALPDNSTKLLNYTATTLDWTASTITSSDHMRLHNKAQIDTNVSASSSLHDSYPFDQKPTADFWRIPTTVPGSSEQMESHHISAPKVPGYYNSEYPPGYSHQWGRNTTVPNQSANYNRPVTYCQSRQNIFSVEQYVGPTSNSTATLRDLLTNKTWPSTQVHPDTAVRGHNYRAQISNIFKCESLTVAETITTNPLWRQNCEEVMERSVNNEPHATLSEMLDEFKSEISAELCEAIDVEKLEDIDEERKPEIIEGNQCDEETSKQSTTSKSTMDESCNLNIPLPKVEETQENEVDDTTVPLDPTESIESQQCHDLRHDSFQNEFKCGPLPPVETLLKNRHQKSDIDILPETENTEETDIIEPSTIAQPESGSIVPDLDCLASTALTMYNELEYSHYREKLNEVARTLSVPYYQNDILSTKLEPVPKNIPTWNSFLQHVTASQVFCHYGCKAIFFSAEEQIQHEMNCLLRVVSCPSELCNWTHCLQSLSNHIFYAHNREVIAKPETYFVVQFKNYKLQDIDDPSQVRVKRFSFYQTHEQRLYVIKVSVDQTTLNVQAYIQYINDALGSHSVAVLEVCCPDGLPVRWLGSVHPFSLNPVHIVASSNCLQFKMDADGWTNNFSLHVKLFSLKDGNIQEHFVP